MSSASTSPDLRRIGGEALIEVLDALVSLSVTEVHRAMESSSATVGPEFRAAVALCGKRISGEVYLSLSEAFARVAADRLLGPSDATSGDETRLGDFVGEVANMVAGRVATSLDCAGYPCQLGTPVVGCGPDRGGVPGPGSKHVRTEWICEGHSLTLEIQCVLSPS